MIKILGLLICLFLIGIISLRVPQQSLGLASVASKTKLLGSPSSAQRALNILTAIGIVIYFAIAIYLNFQIH